MNIKQVPAHTNNYGVGRAGKTVNKIVLHWIVGNLAAADATFQNPNRKASAHYGVEDGEVHQYVKESDTAWHASNLTVNRESIGIEHGGGELLPNGTRRKPSEATHQTSGALVREICKRYSIPIDADHILPHNKFSNTQCPGTLDLNRIIQIAKGGEMPDELEQCKTELKSTGIELELERGRTSDCRRERQTIQAALGIEKDFDLNKCIAEITRLQSVENGVEPDMELNGRQVQYEKNGKLYTDNYAVKR